MNFTVPDAEMSKAKDSDCMEAICADEYGTIDYISSETDVTLEECQEVGSLK